MVRDHIACLFASVPVSDCGREIVLPAPTLAASWPMALVFIPIIGLVGYAYLRALYPVDIDWEPDADRPLETLETRARKFDGL